MKIAIVDYGSGNLRSVSKAIEKIAPVSSFIALRMVSSLQVRSVG